jgi:spore germination cell wall hydrolase CwlJ-like protein
MLRKVVMLLAAVAATGSLTACGSVGMFGFTRLTSRDCLARVMYFESNRSSTEGMLAVGTVVMNRVGHGSYPRSVCGVVGQHNQFAQGVLSKPMSDRRSAAAAYQVADLVLRGARHPAVQDAQFFHTAGWSFPYTNMHYVAVAGGNAFYKKY